MQPRTELIQLQQDRFIRNWRKVSGSEEYPRYRHLADLFFAAFQKFIAVVEGEHLGIMAPLQYELTYINHIDRTHIENPSAHLGQILSVVSEDPPMPVGLEIEDSRFAARYAIRDESSRHVGRLYVAADPARRVSDGEVISRLTLTAKLSPSGPGFEDMRTSLDLAHLAIVRSFVALTTQHMHEVWGRSDVR